MCLETANWNLQGGAEEHQRVLFRDPDFPRAPVEAQEELTEIAFMETYYMNVRTHVNAISAISSIFRVKSEVLSC